MTPTGRLDRVGPDMLAGLATGRPRLLAGPSPAIGGIASTTSFRDRYAVLPL
jgi:hypothetical protein